VDSKIILESFLNVIDIGAIFESTNNYRKRSWQVDLGEIRKIRLSPCCKSRGCCKSDA
jgi:hypothetical protein